MKRAIFFSFIWCMAAMAAEYHIQTTAGHIRTNGGHIVTTTTTTTTTIPPPVTVTAPTIGYADPWSGVYGYAGMANGYPYYTNGVHKCGFDSGDYWLSTQGPPAFGGGAAWGMQAVQPYGTYNPLGPFAAATVSH
jgi:hypothetical protein